MYKFFLLIIVSITILGCQIEEKEDEPSSLSNYFEDSSLPSAIMGSTNKDGETTWYAFGPSLWDKADTVTKDHIFRIFSMTKAVASVAVLQLVEKGLIGLDDPLNELMPEMVSIPILTENDDLIISEQEITPQTFIDPYSWIWI